MQKSLNRLVDSLVKLPGIGRKTAQRIAFYLLKQPDVATETAAAIAEAQSRLHCCPSCYNLTEDALCAVCASQTRDHTVICVVEEPADVMTLELTGQHRGVYHVLGGTLSPMDDVGPDDIRIRELTDRVVRGPVDEVILATNPTTEGEATAALLARQLKPTGVRVTRIGRGLPVGSDLDVADAETLLRAFEGRREL